MVLYYSATGNTEYIAKEIAKSLDDECIDLLDRIKNDNQSILYSDKPFIICAPVYVCEIPRFMAKYLKKQEFSGSRDVYFIFTSGGYSGISGQLTKWMFKKKNMRCHGHAEFKMPRNYVINDAYPMLEKDEIEARILKSRDMISPVVETIKKGGKLKSRHIFLFETLITLPFNPIWCKYKISAKEFYATDECIGCDKCSKLCPLNNIQLKDGKPVWSDSCAHCMACIANCPKDAIEYGDIALDKERYKFDKYSYVVKE